MTRMTTLRYPMLAALAVMLAAVLLLALTQTASAAAPFPSWPWENTAQYSGCVANTWYDMVWTFWFHAAGYTTETMSACAQQFYQ